MRVTCSTRHTPNHTPYLLTHILVTVPTDLQTCIVHVMIHLTTIKVGEESRARSRRDTEIKH